VPNSGEVWEGDAADGVRDNVDALASWARETGDAATEVSGCVTEAVDGAASVRAAMPPPVDGQQVDGAGLMPHCGTLGPQTVAQAFIGGGFQFAPVLVTDLHTETFAEARGRHEQAARVMDQFQTQSRRVYRSVPEFDDQRGSGGPRGGPGLKIDDPRPAGAGRTRRSTPEPTAADTTTSAAAGGVGAGTAGGSPAAGYGASPAVPHPPAESPALVGAASGRRASAGGPVTGRAAAPAGPAGLGAMPFGGTTAGQDGDRRHKPCVYPADDFWTAIGDGLSVSVPVIGTDPRDA